MTTKQNAYSSLSRRKTIWIIIAVVLLAAGGGYIYFSKILQPQQNINGSTEQTAIVQRGDLVLSAAGTGTLVAGTEASFGFQTGGQVAQINVKVGDQVKVGEVLAQLDDTLAQIKYSEAQQALQELYSAASIAAVEKEIGTAQDAEFQARTWLEYLISPEVVEAEEKVASAGEKLAEAQAEAKANPSDAANLKVKESQAEVSYWQQKLDQAWTSYRNVYGPVNFGVYENVGSKRHPKQVLATYTDPHTGKELPKINWPSAADLAKARNNYAQAQQTVKDDEAYLQALSTGTTSENATGDRFTNLYNAQLAVNNAKTALDTTTLLAPIDGTVTSLDLNLGEQVDTSAVITVSQLSQPYLLDAFVDETDWKMVQSGNKVDITFDLLAGQTFPGTVTLIYPELNSSGNSASVHFLVKLDQSISQDLPAGTGATVNVVGGAAKGALLVPVAAIHKTADGKSAIYVIQNGQPVEKIIEVGLENASYAEIKSGLEAGQIVMTKQTEGTAQ